MIFCYRFLRGIAYRKFKLFMGTWVEEGYNVPLPACSYHAIRVREIFPEPSAYTGFETEDAQ